MERQCQHQLLQHKIPDRKSICTVNLRSKLFLTTVANTDIGSLKFFHTFLKKYLYHILVKFEQNCVVQSTRNFELLTKKQFLKPFSTKRWRHFGRRFCRWNNCLMLNYLFSDYFQTTIFQCYKNYSIAINK